MDVSAQLVVAPLVPQGAPADVLVNCGDKIIVPPSLLTRILGDGTHPQREDAPVTVELAHRGRRTRVCGGILDFTAEDGRVVLPQWMTAALRVTPGDAIVLRTVDLPKAEACTFEPESPDFLAVHDYRAVLEAALSARYVALCKGAIVVIEHDGHKYPLRVRDLSPADMCALTNTDVVGVRAAWSRLVRRSGQFGLARYKAVTQLLTASQPQAVDIVSPGAPPTEARQQARSLAFGEPVQAECTDASYIRHSFTLPSDGEYDVTCTASPGADIEAYVGPVGATAREWHVASPLVDECGRAAIPVRASMLLGEPLELAVRAYGVPGCAYSVTLSQRTAAGATAKGSEQTAASVPVSVCQNCRESVPAERLPLHSAYCERNNVYCGVCERAVRRGDASHVHCADCGMLTPSPAAAAKHAALRHVPVPCECGTVLRDMSAVPAHVTSECPRRMTTCRFCGNRTRAGQPSSDPNDRLRGFTEHESRCGGRTEQCRDCGRPVRLRDWERHSQVHEFDKRQARATQSPSSRATVPVVDDALRNAVWERAFPSSRGSQSPVTVAPLPQYTRTPPPQRFELPPPAAEERAIPAPAIACANVSCGYSRGASVASVCGRCAAVVGTASGPELLAALIRRYHTQLTYGCGVEGCFNRDACVSGGAAPLSSSEAAVRAVEMARMAVASPPRMFVCPPPTAEGRGRAQAATSLSEMGFPREWCVRALDVTGDDAAAAAVWLVNNAEHIAVG